MCCKDQAPGAVLHQVCCIWICQLFQRAARVDFTLISCAYFSLPPSHTHTHTAQLFHTAHCFAWHALCSAHCGCYCDCCWLSHSHWGECICHTRLRASLEIAYVVWGVCLLWSLLLARLEVSRLPAVPVCHAPSFQNSTCWAWLPCWGHVAQPFFGPCFAEVVWKAAWRSSARLGSLHAS